MNDAYNLHRFVVAQDSMWPRPLGELEAGQKQSHWMWFVFPQIEGLGTSPTAQKYAIGDADEALEYLAHSVLGPRIRQCSQALLQHNDRTAADIFGLTDSRKLRSSMTLFATVTPEENPFSQVLERYFGGRQDAATLRLMDA